jgi:hypothetical protein
MKTMRMCIVLQPPNVFLSNQFPLLDVVLQRIRRMVAWGTIRQVVQSATFWRSEKSLRGGLR